MQAEVTIECKACHKLFTYRKTGCTNRAYCSEQCQKIGIARSTRMSYLRRKGLSEEEITDMMASWEPGVRQESICTKELREELRTPGRRCAWVGSNGKESCITVLSTYNPGPYCFTHSQIASAQAFKSLQEKQEQERRKELLEAS